MAQDIPSDMPLEIQQRVNDELPEGEKTRWIAQPIPRFFTRPAAVLFLFGLFVVGLLLLAIVLPTKHPTEHGDDFGKWLGLSVFSPVALLMLSAPVWAYRRALRTAYVITDRRAIIFIWDWFGKIQSYRPDELRKAYRKESRDGSGDVIFEKEVVFVPNSRPVDLRPMYVEIGFIRVRDVRKVERMVKELAEKQSGQVQQRGSGDTRVI
jgi:hypothetical protein